LDPFQQNALNQALDGMWAKFFPLIDERVGILESAAAAFTGNRLSLDERQAAGAAAHKLAGVLGTFGLTEGTNLARELETMYSSQCDPDSAVGARLTSIAAELRAIVRNRK
jgi:HPt (histidine-containing phosphotransfer) domain-containing protein